MRRGVRRDGVRSRRACAALPQPHPARARARLVVGGDRRRRRPGAGPRRGRDATGSATRRLLRARHRARGAPRQRRRRRCFGGLVDLRPGRRRTSGPTQAHGRPAGPGGRLRARRPGCRRRSPAACCPPTVPHADAAANAGRAALLVAALAGAPEQLLRGDRGLPAPATTAGPRCRSRSPSSTGCAPTGHAAVVSGAGPTVLVLTVERDLDRSARVPGGWRCLVLDVARVGVPRRLTSTVPDDDRAPPARATEPPIAGVGSQAVCRTLSRRHRTSTSGAVDLRPAGRRSERRSSIAADRRSGSQLAARRLPSSRCTPSTPPRRPCARAPTSGSGSSDQVAPGVLRTALIRGKDLT